MIHVRRRVVWVRFIFDHPYSVLTWDISRFIFWGMSYMVLYPGRSKWANYWRIAETLVNYLLILIGLYILGAGTYVRALFELMHLCDATHLFP